MKRNNTGKKSAEPMSREAALVYAAGLCAASEQCEQAVREKLSRRSVSPADADAVIDYLYEHRYLDAARFACAYARDKHRFNGWGRIKLRIMLSGLRIPSAQIRDALDELDETEYFNRLCTLTASAAKNFDLNSRADCEKLMRRLYSRGFEPELVRKAIAHVRNEDAQLRNEDAHS